MKKGGIRNWLGGSSLVLAGVLASTSLALAQRDESRAAGALLAGAFLMFILVVVLVTYIYMAICLQTIAKKTNTPDGWLAWIPIANCVLMLNIAHKPVWWIVLMLIPLVNIVIWIIVWMEIAKARGKPEWWGILTIVPVLNLVAPGYLAFAD
jgi:Ca2+/Na+ antiporter